MSFFIHCCLLLFSVHIFCARSSVSSLVYCGQKKQAGLLFKQNFRHEWCQRLQSNLNRIVEDDNTRIVPGLQRKRVRSLGDTLISVSLQKGCS